MTIWNYFNFFELHNYGISFEVISFDSTVRCFGDAIKSWFGLFNLFSEANQVVIEDNLHASTFSDIATLRELLRYQLQVITSWRSKLSLLVEMWITCPLNRWASQVWEGWTLLKLFLLRNKRQKKNVDMHIVVNVLYVDGLEWFYVY